MNPDPADAARFHWTAEIQRNIIGERVLGLPRDRDPYAGQPFEERTR